MQLECSDEKVAKSGRKGAQGIVDGELLLLMVNYKDDSNEKKFNKEIQMLSPEEKDALEALLLF